MGKFGNCESCHLKFDGTGAWQASPSWSPSGGGGGGGRLALPARLPNLFKCLFNNPCFFLTANSII